MKDSVFFVTGTCTGVGKTLFTTQLIETLVASGKTVAGLKPVASGAEDTPEGLRNEDALAIEAVSNAGLRYDEINPITLAPPVAPHIAAREVGQELSVQRLSDFCHSVISRRFDVVVIEGAGGWEVPLNERETFADFVNGMALPVILVVGMKLGCLNHALLTVKAIEASGARLVGWVANQVNPEMLRFEENIKELKQRIPAPCIAEIPYLTNSEKYTLSNIDWLLLP